MKKMSLRTRIFLAILFLVGVTSVLIALVTVSQFKKQTDHYYKARFERKELAIRKNVNNELERTIYPTASQFIGFIFRDRINEIATVHNMRVNIYDMNGILQLTSKVPWFRVKKTQLSAVIINTLKSEPEYQSSQPLEDGRILQSSYSYIQDKSKRKVGVLKIEYLQDNSAQEAELVSFLTRLFAVYVLMFVIAVALAYFLSSYITRSLKSISDKIKETQLLKKNSKIDVTGVTSEISILVESYNDMIDQLELSAVELSKNQRELAWREMAKQVAHEIKNPLTPMKLTVQSFERNFDPNDEDIIERVKEYSEMLTQQIDVMSSIASAFSDFAQMPQKNVTQVDLVQLTKGALDVFYEDGIQFNSAEESIVVSLDKNQITRVVTNLVKNAFQATESKNREIVVSLNIKGNKVCLSVKDNGCGISELDKTQIFEPKFTTKSSGMGLGLPMVKNIIESYEGEISFSSSKESGTEFIILLPLK
ncbi:ATP-binding protein [Flavobacteriaceae bacterium]|nr:ATP-binding protein [Flavobacteriaceae bacterium]